MFGRAVVRRQFIRWSPFEDHLLRDYAGMLFNVSEMAPRIGRGQSSIRWRASKLGIALSRRGRHYAPPPGKASNWGRAERLCAFASVPLELAQYVVSVADIRGILLTDLRSERRLSKLVQARVSIARKARSNGYTFEAIARALNRDHTTIVHYVYHHAQKAPIGTLTLIQAEA